MYLCRKILKDMSFLTRKYPFKQSEHWLRDSIIYGVIIWAILYLLQPGSRHLRVDHLRLLRVLLLGCNP